MLFKKIKAPLISRKRGLATPLREPYLQSVNSFVLLVLLDFCLIAAPGYLNKFQPLQRHFFSLQRPFHIFIVLGVGGGGGVVNPLKALKKVGHTQGWSTVRIT